MGWHFNRLEGLMVQAPLNLRQPGNYAVYALHVAPLKEAWLPCHPIAFDKPLNQLEVVCRRS